MKRAIVRPKADLRDSGLVISAVAMLISVLISALIMAVCGYNPLEAYSAILAGAFGSLRGIAQTLAQATPLIFTGLAFSFAKKASLINLGVEGQMYMGALGAALVGITDLGVPAVLHVSLAVLSGFLFGAAYAAIMGFLKVRFGSNEVVAGVMLNSIATYFINYLLNGALLAEGSSVAQTERVCESARLPRIFSNYQVTIAVFLAILACAAIRWFSGSTVLGYEIRSVGMNKKAAETAGIRIGKALIIAMCVSGGIAGLAGANQVLGVILAGLIFGVLRAGAMELNRSTGIPVEFVDVIQAMVVIFVSAPLMIRHMGQAARRFQKKPAVKEA